jgi:hypothetical protein
MSRNTDSLIKYSVLLLMLVIGIVGLLLLMYSK